MTQDERLIQIIVLAGELFDMAGNYDTNINLYWDIVSTAKQAWLNLQKDNNNGN